MLLRLLILATLAATLAASTAQALQLGETAAQIKARHGGGMEDRAKHTTTFMWSGWTLRVQFADGVARTLTYKRVEPLKEADALAILAGHGTAADWQKLPTDNAVELLWKRKDGAIAEWKAASPYVLTLEAAGSPRARQFSDEKPQVVLTAPPAAEPKVAEVPAAEPLVEEPLAVEEDPAIGPPVELVAREEPVPPVAADVPGETVQPIVPNQAATGTVAPSSVLPKVIAALSLLAGLGFALTSWLRRPQAPPAGPRPGAQTPNAAGPFDLQALHSLSSAEFELLIGELHRRDGFEVELPVAVGTDEDIDLVLERDFERTLVQCKHWKSQKVGAAAVRTFHEAMKASGSKRGLLVTTGEFSREAVDYVAGRPLKLINGKTLGRLAQKHQRPGEALQQPVNWMDEFVAAAHWIEPRCPGCESQMTLRKSAEAGQRLWLCTTAPRCDGKRSARRELLDRKAVTRPERRRDSAVIDV
ncbi:MAG TPA: restriction endonuclease [Chthoniobacteraceae bacterium]|jgi:hypothetical protein